MTNIIHRRRAERSRKKHPWKYDGTPAPTAAAPTPAPEPEEEAPVEESTPKAKKRSMWSRKKKS